MKNRQYQIAAAVLMCGMLVTACRIWRVRMRMQQLLQVMAERAAQKTGRREKTRHIQGQRSTVQICSQTVT